MDSNAIDMCHPIASGPSFYEITFKSSRERLLAVVLDKEKELKLPFAACARSNNAASQESSAILSFFSGNISREEKRPGVEPIHLTGIGKLHSCAIKYLRRKGELPT